MHQCCKIINISQNVRSFKIISRTMKECLLFRFREEVLGDGYNANLMEGVKTQLAIHAGLANAVVVIVVALFPYQSRTS